MPNGYLTVLPNGDVIPCMLLQAKLGNVREEAITVLWEQSEMLARLRDRALLKGRCGRKHNCRCLAEYAARGEEPGQRHRSQRHINPPNLRILHAWNRRIWLRGQGHAEGGNVPGAGGRGAE